MSENVGTSLSLDDLLDAADPSHAFAGGGAREPLEAPSSDLLRSLLGYDEPSNLPVAEDEPRAHSADRAPDPKEAEPLECEAVKEPTPISLENLPALPKIPKSLPVPSTEDAGESSQKIVSEACSQRAEASPAFVPPSQNRKRLEPPGAHEARPASEDRFTHRAFRGKHASASHRALQPAVETPRASEARSGAKQPSVSVKQVPQDVVSPDSTKKRKAKQPHSADKEARLEEMRAIRDQLEARMADLAQAETPSQQAKAPDRAFTPSGLSLDEDSVSPLFEQRPHSIAEGMKEAQSEHQRAVRLQVLAGAAGGLLVMVLMVGGAVQLSQVGAESVLKHTSAGQISTTLKLASAPSTEVDAQESSKTASDQPKVERESSQGTVVNEDAAAESDGKTASKTNSQQDLSGTVVYRYAKPGNEADKTSVTEKVTFGGDGLCESSSLEVQFSDASAAEEFLRALELDFGTAYCEGEVKDNVATAVVDVSSNKLDREGYEDALRDSVVDLVIVKKS